MTQGWTLTTEDKPQRNKLVLVTVRELPTEAPRVCAARWNGEQWLMDGGPRTDERVPAWMPMPPPYETQDEERARVLALEF